MFYPPVSAAPSAAPGVAETCPPLGGPAQKTEGPSESREQPSVCGSFQSWGAGPLPRDMRRTKESQRASSHCSWQEVPQDDTHGYMLPTFCVKVRKWMNSVHGNQSPGHRLNSNQSQDDFVMRPESKLIHNWSCHLFSVLSPLPGQQTQMPAEPGKPDKD